MAKKKKHSLTDIQALIITLIQRNEKMYGLDMVKQSNGILKRGTIYVTLDRMEDYGLIESHEKKQAKGEQGPIRRVYELTGDGAVALVDYVERKRAFNAEFGGAV